ncbi:MAG: formylglycine-generating enzyme family protein [Magnetococcus sp. DMHC-1]|nr:formylglycine-generating enzyme family protein [Magnetococcales bacterium]
MERSRGKGILLGMVMVVAWGWMNPGFCEKGRDLEFVRVPGGCFQMGSSDSDAYDDEQPLHEVCLDTFEIGKYEVTQAQWRAVMGSNPAEYSACGDECPVEQVSWDDVQAFIKKLNVQGTDQYRLPTEAEWEYACRSGGKAEKYSGGQGADQVAWYGDNSSRTTHRVGTKAANGLGIHDMSGNVYEWVLDTMTVYKKASQKNPVFDSGDVRLMRGGSWLLGARTVRCTSRVDDATGFRNGLVGTRLIRIRQPPSPKN